jgi:hypothetical protein
MQGTAFALGEEISLRTVAFRLWEAMWIKYDLSAVNLSLDNWTTIKYLNADGTDFSDEIDQLPADRGGLYMFSINCPIIPGRTEFPAYIGRAKLTDGQNLRKRCREYFTKYAREDERPKITRLFSYWSKELYLSFIALDENDQIVDFEAKLINSLLLPFNDLIPDKVIRDAVKAF